MKKQKKFLKGIKRLAVKPVAALLLFLMEPVLYVWFVVLPPAAVNYQAFYWKILS
jgi:hypothetical protein